MDDRVEWMLGKVDKQLAEKDYIVDLFGFSRGSASATLFLNRLQERIESKDSKYNDYKKLQIRFVALFDQVPSKSLAVGQLAGNTVDLWGYLNTLAMWQPNTYARNANNEGFTLPKNMKFVHTPIHVISLDEQRKEFAVSDLGNNAHQIAFKGDHSNAGGGNGGSMFEFITREYVMEQSMKAGLDLWEDLSKLPGTKYVNDLRKFDEKYRGEYERYSTQFSSGSLPLLPYKANDMDAGGLPIIGNPVFNGGEFRHMPKNMILHESVKWFSEESKHPLYKRKSLFDSTQVLKYPYHK